MSRAIIVRVVAAAVLTVFSVGTWVTSGKLDIGWLRFFSASVHRHGRADGLGPVAVAVDVHPTLSWGAEERSRHLERNTDLALDGSEHWSDYPAETGVPRDPANRESRVGQVAYGRVQVQFDPGGGIRPRRDGRP
jgi:hypothetical protein